MEFAAKPRIDLAEKILPRPIYQSLLHIFTQGISGCVLIGGTALAGFYAGHRRSADLDFFTKDKNSQKGAILAVKSLAQIGAKIEDEFQTNLYYRALCIMENHRFTVDISIDQNFFEVGHFDKLVNGIVVADLETILMTKAATLVSRCSEKDLYDLIWILDNYKEVNFQALIDLGHKIDKGVNGEALLLSIAGTQLQQDACDFSLSPSLSKKEIYQEISTFQKELIRNLSLFLKNQPAPPLKKLIDKIKKFSA